MQLFTVSMPECDEGLVDKMKCLLALQADAALHSSAPEASDALVLFDAVQGHIYCQAVLPNFQLKHHGEAIYRSAAMAVAEFIVSELEPALMSAIIRKKQRLNPSLDAELIEKYCHVLIHGEDQEGLGVRFHEADRARRKGKVAQELEGYLETNTTLHLQGVTTFRLNAYRSELMEIVDYAIDEYVLDKQYQEFISLLKYFVQLQETKVPHVHLLHKGGHDFVLYNESFQTLEPKPHGDRIVAEMLETEMNIEDMVISSLISVSPGHITIHTRNPEMGAIRTIQTIFGQRVTVCLQCSSCSRGLDGVIQP